MTHFNQETFKEALAGDQLVVVDFWAPWCGPCQMLGPFIEDLASRYEGKAIVGKVNTDEEMELAIQHGITNIPAILFFKGGKEVHRIVGVQAPDTFVKAVEDNL